MNTNLYKKMILVMEEVGQLGKDGDINDKNGKKMYSYLSEERSTGELQRAFIKFGLVMFPIKVEEEIVYLEGIMYDKPFKNAITKVTNTYRVADAESGESIEVQSVGYGADSQDKGSNKAMSTCFKYAQRQTFMISSGEDGDHVSSESIDRKLMDKAKIEGIPLIGSKEEATELGAKKLAEQKAKAAYNKTSDALTPDSLQKEIFGMINKKGMSFPDLNEFATATLGREIKFFKKDCVDLSELQKIKEALT